MYQENHYKKGQEKPISQKVAHHQNLSRQVTQVFFVLFIENDPAFQGDISSDTDYYCNVRPPGKDLNCHCQLFRGGRANTALYSPY